MTAVVHIVGPVIRVGPVERQRCMWCGAVLIDTDYERVAVELLPDGSPGPGPAVWEVGALISVEGESPKMWVMVRTADEAWGCPGHEEPAELPAECCARIDPAVTA